MVPVTKPHSTPGGRLPHPNLSLVASWAQPFRGARPKHPASPLVPNTAPAPGWESERRRKEGEKEEGG